MRPTFDEALCLELVDDERRVGGIDAADLGELGERQRSLAELEEDLADRMGAEMGVNLGALMSSTVTVGRGWRVTSAAGS